MPDPVTVHIADDHEMFAQGLAVGLAERYRVSGITRVAEAVATDVAANAPDILLLDISLGGSNGLRLIRPLLATHRALRIIVVTMHSERLLADAAFQAGAHGFVPKDSGLGELLRAIERVARGQRYLTPGVICHVGGQAEGTSLLAGLTPRQREILLLIGQDIPSTAIAARLRIAEPTVAFHRQRIRAALGIKTESELLRFAILARASTPAP